jgi:hypothetical protein
LESAPDKFKEREIAFSTIKARIKRLADTPEKAIEMMDQNPFPRTIPERPKPPVRYKPRRSWGA